MLRLQMRCRAQPTALRPVLECAMLCRAPTSSSSPQNLARAAFSASLHRAARPLPQRQQQQPQTYDTRRAVLVGEGGSRPRRESSTRSGTLIDSQRRPASTTAAADAAAGSNSSSSSSGSSSSRLPDLDKVLSLVTQARDRLLAHPGIPTEGEIKATLSVCAEAADLIMDAAVQPRLSSIDHQADTVASTLLSLDGRSLSGSSPASASAPTTASTASSPSSSPSSSSSPSMAASSEHQPRLRYVIGEISDAAYAVVEDPRVSITPRLLEQYIHIQARLARPESLPRVLQLYASKPQPRPGGRSSSSSSDTGIRYVPQNASKPTKAVDAAVADAALETALAAKNLDAAVGVVEHTFAAPAYMRYKMLRKGLLPALALVGLPPATYLLAARLANWQQSMEVATATNMAFASILAYICCTGTIGLVATMTANDQMRRVTWAPGTPLRERWLREEERAALDRVACAFGFSEPYRYGEEEGAEFHALREYIARKGMLVDQIELQGGMS